MRLMGRTQKLVQNAGCDKLSWCWPLLQQESSHFPILVRMSKIGGFYTGILHQGILENVFPRFLDVPARDNPKEVEMILSVENLTQFPSSILKTRIFYVPLLQICLF